MQKFLVILERYVQWIALGIGSLLLLWTAYGYILQPPAFVELKGQKLTAGEIDPKIKDGPVQIISRQLNSTDVPAMPLKDHVRAFVQGMAGNDSLAQATLRPMFPGGLTGGSGKGPIGDPKGPENLPVTELPKLEPIAIANPVTGRSTVQFPDPDFQPNRNDPKAKPDLIKADKEWVTVSGKIDTAEMAQNFKAALGKKGVPSTLMQTAVIKVELIRQEQLPSGKWGAEESVPPLIITEKRPFPAKDAAPTEILQYLDWAGKNADDVMQPAFYQVLDGDRWRKSPDTVKVSDDKPPRPKTPVPEVAPPKPRKPTDPKHGGAGAPKSHHMSGSGRGPSAGQTYAARDVDRPSGAFPTAGPAPAGGPMFAPGAGPKLPGATAGKAQGKFDPANVPDIDVWAHDDTVKPGMTYRYKMHYVILNPVYTTVGVAPKELAGQFAIVSPDSEWTKPITVSPLVNFWVATIGLNGGVQFDVFTWKGGGHVKTRITAFPGDAVGPTGWTVVDQRRDLRTNDAYVLLVNENGELIRRDPNVDRRDKTYLIMQAQQARSGQPEAEVAGGRGAMREP